MEVKDGFPPMVAIFQKHPASFHWTMMKMGERVVNVVVSQYVGVLTIINPCKLVGFMSPKHDYNLLANHKQY